MFFSTITFHYRVLSVSLLTIGFVSVVSAAPGDLANTPLFTTNSAAPNVVFQIDDSGSMDDEVFTLPHWDTCAYKDYNNTSCGEFRTDGYSRDKNSVSYRTTHRIFENTDDVGASDANCDSGTGATGTRGVLELCSVAFQNSDWRIKSSGLNVIYYNPDSNYRPWKKGDGTPMNAASFTAVKSNPQPGRAGFTSLHNLAILPVTQPGFVYHVWHDTHGFNGARPLHDPTNKDSGANGLVDWWDEHDRYTVEANKITIEHISYDGVQGNTKQIDSTQEFFVTDGSRPELGNKTVAEVQQNIANWYEYYRRRSFVAKGAVAGVIDDNPDYRYALTHINSNQLTEVPAGSASIAHNTSLITTMLDRVVNNDSGTPLRKGLNKVGEYLENSDGRVDPIIEQCQQNFALLITDGYWNGSRGSLRNINPDGDGHNDTVADVAKYFYDTDLSTLPDNVVGNVFDPATHQHMVTYTVAFGLNGAVVDTDGDGWPDKAGTGANIGTRVQLVEGDDWGDPHSDDTGKMDDLWHAAFNSKGTFVAAATPEEVSKALSDALSNISDRVGSAASVAFNTTTLTGSSSVFLAQFNSSNNKWSGDLLSFPLDSVTGSVAADPSWSAATVLGARVNPVSSRNIFTYNETLNNGRPFLWADLAANQKADLRINPDGTSSNDTKAEARLNFLRGDVTNEDDNNGTYTFRNRNKLLGDIVHSAPIFVGKPDAPWPNIAPFPSTVGTNTYTDFASGSAKTRDPMLYVGANDGMLHGFNASDGSEAMAYIPSSLFSTDTTKGLHHLTDPGYSHRYYVDLSVTVSDVFIDKDDGAGDDWYTLLIGGGRNGGKGLFALDITDPDDFVQDNSHAEKLVLWEFDGTDDSDMGFSFSKPTIAMMNNGEWAAIFGNGYNSTGTGEAVLFIVFLEGGLDGTWTDGTAGTPVDYIKISTEDGAIVSSDCDNAGSDCNGLSTPQAVDVDGDSVVDRVYAGDLKGNMWAFDLSSTSSNPKAHWKVAYKQGSTPKPLFTATHHAAATAGAVPTQVSATAQPITDKPAIVFHSDELGGDPDILVFFGTGQYLVDGDISTTTQQSFYGVWDNGTKELTPANLIEQTFVSATFLDADSVDISARVRVLTDHTVDYAGGKKGWMINLDAASGERVIVDADVRGDIVFFNTWIPDSNPCSAGGSGFLMSVNQHNGGRTDDAAFDLNDDGTLDGDDIVTANGNNYAPSGETFDAGLPASSNFLSDKQYTPGTDGIKIDERVVPTLSGAGTGRLSWQELRN